LRTTGRTTYNSKNVKITEPATISGSLLILSITKSLQLFLSLRLESGEQSEKTVPP